MQLSWSGRRQLLYSSVAAVLLLFLGWLLYVQIFTAVPTCTDGAQNGNERGIDCGGSCALVCRHEARAPVVLWARAFPSGASLYSAAAYVQNHNVGAGAKGLEYSFQLFDANNLLVVERRGVIDIPPLSVVPVVEPNIDIGNRSVTKTLFTFGNEAVWYRLSHGLPMFRTTNQQLESDGSRLVATIHNDSSVGAPNTSVYAVLFDASGVARAASKSVVSIGAKGSQEVVFTWNPKIGAIVRGEITVVPEF